MNATRPYSQTINVYAKEYLKNALCENTVPSSGFKFLSWRGTMMKTVSITFKLHNTNKSCLFISIFMWFDNDVEHLRLSLCPAACRFTMYWKICYFDTEYDMSSCKTEYRERKGLLGPANESPKERQECEPLGRAHANISLNVYTSGRRWRCFA